MSADLCLKVDVCTHQGMRDGVPRLLEQFRRLGAKATFCLAVGPDNSGRAVLQVLRPGFLRKMVRTGAPGLYGVRTMLSGTLLPARPIASAFPDVVRRIAAEGHEVALHGWDHRTWQDRVERMDLASIRADYERAATCISRILGHAPAGAGAPAWIATAASLAVQDELGLAWASDLRGGPLCRLRAGGRVLRTPQVPTTGPCVEELLAVGVRDAEEIVTRIVGGAERSDPAVVAVHAEVEGGPYAQVLDQVVVRFRGAGRTVRTLGELIASRDPASLPVRDLVHTTLPGRSGRVASAA